MRKVEYYENTSYITAHDLSTCSCRIFNKKIHIIGPQGQKTSMTLLFI